MASTSDRPPSNAPPPSSAPSDPSPQTATDRPGPGQLLPSPYPPSATNTPLSQKSLKRSAPPAVEVPPLTGAAAAADERQYREETKRQRSRVTSTNPAMTAKNALMGTADQAMSRVQDQGTASEQGNPMTTLANTATVASPLQVDNARASPVSMSGSDRSLTRSGPNVTSAGENPQTPVQTNSRHEDRSNKAMTYPPPPSPGDDSAGRPRNFSYSGTGSANSKGSGKKHKCPECDTEFTRHHNLKSHLLTHSHEKPFTCPNCSAKFRRLHDLKRHSKLHTGERPHICPKCGRKFARGDALARHNKGAGGCAGRRESAAGEDDYGQGLDGSMDGIVYQEPGSDLEDPDRRQSEPNNRRKSSVMSRSETGQTGYSRHSSTYPPVASMAGGQRGSLAAASAAPQQNFNHLSPAAASQSTFSHVQFNPPNYSSHPGMTESPKPLSPGQPESHRLAAPDGSYVRGRSPSLTTQFQQHHFGRGSGRGSPPIGLPPPGMPQPPHLPSLPAISSEPRHNSQQLPPSSKPGGLPPQPPILQSQPQTHHGTLGSNTSSGSSHQQGSGSSMRDITGSSSSHGAIPGSSESQFVDYIRAYEKQLREEFQRNLERELENQGAYFDAELGKLREENAALRGQLNGQKAGHSSNGHSILQPPHTQP